MGGSDSLEEGLLEQHRLLENQEENEEGFLPDRAELLLEDPPGAEAKSTSFDSVSNLTNVILGAGMYALPRVFGGLGLIGGTLAIVLVAALTYFSITVMLRSAEATNTWTYAHTMERAWGRPAAAAVHAAVIAGCVGFVALYLIVTCDILVGNSVYTGIIADLFPNLPDPLPWYFSRPALLTAIAAATVPLLSAHTLHGMAATSAVSVSMSIASMVLLLALFAGAAVRGNLAPLRLWPSLSFFGDQPKLILVHLVATLPVVMTAFICHMSVHPIARDLRNYTPRRMRRVAAWSLAICSLLYAATGASGYQVFGDEVEGDVLSNVQPETVTAVLGCSDAAGLAFSATLKSCVALAMLTSIPINLWPLREEVMGLLTAALGGETPSKAAFYSVTYASLGGIWAISIAVKSAYSMVGLTGATCGIAMAFAFPGMLAMRMPGGVVGGWVLVVLGGVLMAAGVASTLMGID